MILRRGRFRKTKRTSPRSPHNIEPLSPFFYWGNKFLCVSFPLCVALLKTLPRNSISIFEVSADTPKMEILLRKNVLSNATRHQAALLVGESIDIRPVQEVVTCACSHAIRGDLRNILQRSGDCGHLQP